MSRQIFSVCCSPRGPLTSAPEVRFEGRSPSGPCPAARRSHAALKQVEHLLYPERTPLAHKATSRSPRAAACRSHTAVAPHSRRCPPLTHCPHAAPAGGGLREPGEGPSGPVGGVGRVGWYGPVGRKVCTARKGVRVCGVKYALRTAERQRIENVGEKLGGWGGGGVG